MRNRNSPRSVGEHTSSTGKRDTRSFSSNNAAVGERGAQNKYFPLNPATPTYTRALVRLFLVNFLTTLLRLQCPFLSPPLRYLTRGYRFRRAYAFYTTANRCSYSFAFLGVRGTSTHNGGVVENTTRTHGERTKWETAVSKNVKINVYVTLRLRRSIEKIQKNRDQRCSRVKSLKKYIYDRIFDVRAK